MFHDFMFGGMWFGWIIWLAVFVFIGWFVINQVNKNKQDNQNSYHESPLDVLKKRYAKGEITKEQFEQMKRDLT